MATTADVTIAVEVTQPELARQLLAVADGRAVQGKAFDGSGEVLTLLITLTPSIVAPLVMILQSAWSRNQHVRVVHNGTEVQGVSEKVLRQFFELTAAPPGRPRDQTTRKRKQAAKPAAKTPFQKARKSKDAAKAKRRKPAANAKRKTPAAKKAGK